MHRSHAEKLIVHILCSFSLSGAHIFAINLANEQAKNYRVYLISLNPKNNDANLLARIDDRVKVININASRLIKSAAYWIGHCVSGMAQNNPLFTGLMAWKLKKFLSGADIVHTHFVRDRYIVSKAMKLLGEHAPKHIMTDHGGFLGLEMTKKENGIYRKPYSKKLFEEIFDSCTYIVTLSETQNAFWQRKQSEGYLVSYLKIYNGNPLSQPISIKSRKEMGYAEDDFIFAMVARGDEVSKGWELTINAFLKNNAPKSKLMLIGGGSEIERLRAIHGNNSNIRFVGLVQNPSAFFHLADVGVLASTYPAESLPNSIIEYLQAGKPVIGSDIGEIKNMLQIGKNEAGILLPVKNNQIDLDTYAAAMRKMQYDKAAYDCFRTNAINAGKQFDIAHCANRYSKEIYSF